MYVYWLDLTKNDIKKQNLDNMEKQIVKLLIKNPRISDVKISELTEIPYRTVNRKRQKLENTGLINYYTELNTGIKGTKTLKMNHFGGSDIFLGVKRFPNIIFSTFRFN